MTIAMVFIERCCWKTRRELPGKGRVASLQNGDPGRQVGQQTNAADVFHAANELVALPSKRRKRRKNETVQ